MPKWQPQFRPIQVPQTKQDLIELTSASSLTQFWFGPTNSTNKVMPRKRKVNLHFRVYNMCYLTKWSHFEKVKVKKWLVPSKLQENQLLARRLAKIWQLKLQEKLRQLAMASKNHEDFDLELLHFERLEDIKNLPNYCCVNFHFKDLFEKSPKSSRQIFDFSLRQ